MPEYDPTNPPKNLADALTRAEAGTDTPTADPAAWPRSPMLPDEYAGPPASREFETAVLGGSSRRGRALAPDPDPVEKPQTPISPAP